MSKRVDVARRGASSNTSRTSKVAAKPAAYSTKRKPVSESEDSSDDEDSEEEAFIGLDSGEDSEDESVDFGSDDSDDDDDEDEDDDDEEDVAGNAEEEEEEEEEEEPQARISFAERMEIIKDGRQAVNPKTLAELKEGLAETRRKELIKQKQNRGKPKPQEDDAPREMSSKIPVGRRRNVVKVEHSRRRDPRFDSRTGVLNEGGFHDAYQFVTDIQRQELQSLKKKKYSKKNKRRGGSDDDDDDEDDAYGDEESRYQIDREINVLNQQIHDSEERQRLRHLKRGWREEQEDRIRRGQKAYYLKDSDIKKQLKEKKIEDMRRRGGEAGVSKYQVRQRKRDEAKVRKRMPTRRTDVDKRARRD